MAKKRKRGVSSCVCVVSLGCPKNRVDTEVMLGTLASAGFGITLDPDEADVLLINTCAFIAPAREEADSEIRAALEWKAAAPDRRRVVVSGCLPQRNGAELLHMYEGVDLVLGLDDVPNAGQLLTALVSGSGARPCPPRFGRSDYLYDHDTPRLLSTPPAYSYVKIAEGCSHGCRFCAIPSIRGGLRSRFPDSVTAECRNLLDMGVFELNLVAQDTTAYGRDLTPPVALAELLRACDSFPGDYWLRLLYTHPASFGPDMMAVFRDSAHLVPYLDMPLQHIRDSLLKAMGRRFSEADTRRLVDRIREELPDVALRTTFLVGFPGETDADFEALLAFVRETGFERLGVFAFSPEPGTPAAAMTEGLVPEAVAVDRCNAIMAAQQEIALEHNRRLVGETLSVLLEAPEEDEGDWWGRTTWDAPDIDDGVLVQGVPDDPLPVVHARVTAAGAYDLEAVFVSPA